MKYNTEVTINLPLLRVIELFDSSENLYKWQPGLKSFEVISGEPRQEGTLSRMVYEGRKGDLVMTKTILKRALPGEFHELYETRGVNNKMYNYFTESEPGKTHWRTLSVFRFRGLMFLMAPFMSSAFQNNTLLNMERFKTFAEGA